MQRLIAGMKVRYRPQPEWGVGHVAELGEDGFRARVAFPGRDEEATWVSLKGNVLTPHRFEPGDEAADARGRRGRILSEEEGGRGLRRYAIRFDDGEEDELPESALRGPTPRSGILGALADGRVADARGFLLRREALSLDDERRCDAWGALVASRVMVQPHQIGVVQRVLSAPRPRFILADEVGLGKTIETGMVFSALRMAGLARRVLIVAPSHLTVQWLAELFHKFNQLFTLMDGERYESALKENPGVSPWVSQSYVVTSLELLSRSSSHLDEATSEQARWDLVVFDEAHHLKGKKAFEVAQRLAAHSWGLLLLTATPMQLDPDEYRSLLHLIDPEAAPDADALRERLTRQEELARVVKRLLPARGEADGPRGAAGVEGDGGAPGTAMGDPGSAEPGLEALARRYPDDPRLAAPPTSEEERAALLEHLAETYSLSEQLIRNRRAEVGGFSKRRLHRHPVELGDAERRAREQVLETLRDRGGLSGAPLARLLRRLESSPAALAEAVRNSQALAGMEALELSPEDAKRDAFWRTLCAIRETEPDAKVLVFTEARATLDMLQRHLALKDVEALAYHGDLPLVERDRQVARFRDPEGPWVLVSTEVGGEGRNFQFAHHLVCYDLPWSPSAVEQRIGRLDRIGQRNTVEIHAFEVEGTLAAEVLDLFDRRIGLFEETVGGLDAVLEEVEPQLTRLALAPEEERAAYAARLGAAVGEARAKMRDAYDPLLDLRSFDRPAIDRLLQRAEARLGIDELDPDDTLEDRILAVARDLDERLEETVGELARRIGIGVDTEDQVDAFQCAFHFGHALAVEALPGIDVSEERTALGTFWRDTAVEREEIDFFATGHPMVEALFGFLRDGPFGRTGFRVVPMRGRRGVRGYEMLFHVEPPEPQDTSTGARVPSRQLARFLERTLIRVALVEKGEGVAEASELLPVLEEEGTSLKGDEVRAAFPRFAKLAPEALELGGRLARRELEALAERARSRIEAERDGRIRRLALTLKHQGADAAQRERMEGRERERAHALLRALDGTDVTLDSVCGFAAG